VAKSILSIIVILISFNLYAQDRGSEMQSEIDRLRFELRNHSERISRLERLVSVPTQNEPRPTAFSSNWHDPENWKRIRSGMSTSQVEQILGKPTSTNSIRSYSGRFVTYLYQGDVPGVGRISGNIEFSDKDQVMLVQPPVL
jgi:hypothetical protein